MGRCESSPSGTYCPTTRLPHHQGQERKELTVAAVGCVDRSLIYLPISFSFLLWPKYNNKPNNKDIVAREWKGKRIPAQPQNWHQVSRRRRIQWMVLGNKSGNGKVGPRLFIQGLIGQHSMFSLSVSYWLANPWMIRTRTAFTLFLFLFLFIQWWPDNYSLFFVHCWPSYEQIKKKECVNA